MFLREVIFIVHLFTFLSPWLHGGLKLSCIGESMSSSMQSDLIWRILVIQAAIMYKNMCALYVLLGVGSDLEPLDPPVALAAGGPEVIHNPVRVQGVPFPDTPHGL